MVPDAARKIEGRKLCTYLKTSTEITVINLVPRFSLPECFRSLVQWYILIRGLGLVGGYTMRRSLRL